MIYVVATLTIKPGTLDHLREPAAACIAETRKEAGCISYELFASLTDPQKLVFIERWETREALTAHSKQPHLKAWRDASAPHLVSRSIEIVHPEKVEEFLGGMMYQAVGSPGSRVSRVLWMLEELGAPYEFVKVGLRSPEMYALNPSGKSPALVDGDVVVTDSAAICVYLADRHPEKGMGAAPGCAGRAEMDGWMHFAQSELEAPLWNKLRHRFLLPKDVRVDVGPAAAHDFAGEVGTLERRLGDKEFALGNRFSAVDVLLGDMGAWARAGKFKIESDKVNAYFDRVLSRPARIRAEAKGAK